MTFSGTVDAAIAQFDALEVVASRQIVISAGDVGEMGGFVASLKLYSDASGSRVARCGPSRKPGEALRRGRVRTLNVADIAAVVSMPKTTARRLAPVTVMRDHSAGDG